MRVEIGEGGSWTAYLPVKAEASSSLVELDGCLVGMLGTLGCILAEGHQKAAPKTRNKLTQNKFMLS